MATAEIHDDGVFANPRYRKVSAPPERATQEVLAWGTLHSADFSERTLEFKIQGDMPRVASGRYAIIEADRLRVIVMQANAWREQLKAEKSA